MEDYYLSESASEKACCFPDAEARGLFNAAANAQAQTVQTRSSFDSLPRERCSSFSDIGAKASFFFAPAPLLEAAKIFAHLFWTPFGPNFIGLILGKWQGRSRPQRFEHGGLADAEKTCTL